MKKFAWRRQDLARFRFTIRGGEIRSCLSLTLDMYIMISRTHHHRPGALLRSARKHH